MSIDIPTQELRELVQNPVDLRREVIIAMYQAGELSSSKAREILGMTVFEWDKLRKERGLRGAYGVADLERDVATLQELGLW